MSRRRSLSLAEMLDEAAEVVAGVAAPWLGLLWLTALPLRLLQAHFAVRLLELKAQAAQHGAYLTELAFGMGLLLVPWLWGRAVFVRACGFALRGQRAGRAAWKLRPVALAGYVYVALVIELLFWATAWIFVAAPLFVLMGALAAATHPLIEKPGLIEPLRQLARHGKQVLPLIGLMMVLAVAFLMTLANLHVVFQAGLWLSGALPGLDPGRWQRLLSPDNARYLFTLLVGATLALEPYLLAALTVYVHKVRSRESGEDLRLWLERLQRRAAA